MKVELYYDDEQARAAIMVRLTMQSDDVLIVSKDVWNRIRDSEKLNHPRI